MALQLCRSHCRGLCSWCGVCPLALWQFTCQPLASEMLPWTGCNIDGAERSLHQGAIQVEDLTENLYRMYNCDHRVSSTGPSWPPFNIWTDAAGQILFSLSACNVSMPTLTNFIQQVPQDQFKIFVFFATLLKFQCF